jgi:hypothetical protein|nr:hypothetical protein [Kofleriaceae bacterium]
MRLVLVTALLVGCGAPAVRGEPVTSAPLAAGSGSGSGSADGPPPQPPFVVVVLGFDDDADGSITASVRAEVTAAHLALSDHREPAIDVRLLHDCNVTPHDAAGCMARVARSLGGDWLAWGVVDATGDVEVQLVHAAAPAASRTTTFHAATPGAAHEAWQRLVR